MHWMCPNEVPVQLAKQPVHAEQTEQTTNVPVNSHTKNSNKKNYMNPPIKELAVVSQPDWSNNAD